MADSRPGLLALAQKRLSRTKTKVLQNLGKAERTTDDVFNEIVLRVERQQEVAQHLQKELKSYIHYLREMAHSSKSVSVALSQIYEPEWSQESEFRVHIQSLDLLWSDFLQNVQDSVIVPIHNYMQYFPLLKAKVAKRGRKLVDYDNCRHQLEVLMSTRKREEAKIIKANDELKEAKRVYEELNSELLSELPEFNNSRVTFFASLLSSLFEAEETLHCEMAKVSGSLAAISQQLGKDFEHFVYQPRKALSKSVSSILSENNLTEEVSRASTPSPRLHSPFRGNQKVPYNKQSKIVNMPASHQNPASPEQGQTYQSETTDPTRGRAVVTTDSSSQNVAETREHNLHEDIASDSDNGRNDNIINDINHVRSNDTVTDSDGEYMSGDDEPDDMEPVYNNPTPDSRQAIPPCNTLYTVQATHRYTSEDIDELSFEPGEIIYVMEFDNPEEQDDGWQMGIRSSDGVRGVFPENFTEKISAGGS